MGIISNFTGKISHGISEIQRKNALKNKGKVIYKSKEPLPNNCDPLIEKGYYLAKKKEQDNAARIVREKEEIEKLKRQQVLNLEKLKLAKIKSKLREETKSDY